MTNHYYFYGPDALAKAEKFSSERAEFHPAIYQQQTRICIVLER